MLFQIYLTEFCFKFFQPDVQGTVGVVVQIFFRLFPQRLRNAEVRFRHASRNGGKGVAVAADADRIADGVLKIFRLKKGFKRLRNGVLAGFVELVGIADLIQRKVDGVLILLHKTADLAHRLALPCQKNCHGNRFRTF